jgi:hypothetical protein
MQVFPGSASFTADPANYLLPPLGGGLLLVGICHRPLERRSPRP